MKIKRPINPLTLAAPAVLLVLGALLTGAAASAQESKPPEKPADAAPVKIVRKQSLQIGSDRLAYTSTAEDIQVEDKAGKKVADYFTVSYTKDDVADKDRRPITFVYNGGPGSASLYLHLGLVGPRLIDIPSDATDPGVPPYKLRDNPSTILRATDLVFVDPIGTGFSHAMGEKKGEDFWGFDEDADAVAEFIRTYITRHNRWNSPKYLLGESYGGIRSALLLPRLQGDHGIALNGVILISPALNMATLPFQFAGNELTYVTTLPSMAATAFYHHKIPDQGQYKDLAAFLRDVEKFAGTEYLAALFQGDALDKAAKERTADRLHRFTGLSRDYILRSRLRVTMTRFTKELLRSEGKVTGAHDGRYTQSELDDVSDSPGSDPFGAKTGPIYTELFQSYLRNGLGVELDKPYVSSNGEANGKWKRPSNGRHAFAGFVDVTQSLAQSTKDSEKLRVFAAGGYHDMVTPYFALTYMLGHSGIDPQRLQIHDYPGGHMMYLHRPSAEALSNDIVGFIQGG